MSLQAATDALYRAMLAHDLAALGGLLHDDCTYIHSPGWAETTAAFLAGVRDGAYVYERVRPVEQRFVEDGDLGVVYATLDFVGGPRGEAHAPVTLLTTLVWRRVDGAWRLWLRHATRARQ